MRILIFILLLSTTSLEANEMQLNKLKLVISNIDAERGGSMGVYVFLKDGFPIKHNKAIKQYYFDVDRVQKTIQVEVPKDFEFALKAHHDEDNSGAVTKNWTGFIPAEGFAFSSGVRMRFAPPSFRKAKMTFPENAITHIEMHYP